MTYVDVRANRGARKYTRSETLGRVLWGAARPLFRFSPRPWFRFRAALLRLFGARIGSGVHIYNTAIIYLPWMLEAQEDASVGEWALIYNLGPVTLGPRATVSQRAHLCAGTHDYLKTSMPLLRPPIAVGADAWVCADAYVGPGVEIGAGAIVGARAVVVGNVEPWTIVAGNPARRIKDRPQHGDGE